MDTDNIRPDEIITNNNSDKMRKFFILMCAVILGSVAVQAQTAYTYEESEPYESLIAKSRRCKVVSDSEGYWLYVKDFYSEAFIKVCIGDNAYVAYKSVQQLEYWGRKARKMSYVEYICSGKHVVVFKNQFGQLLMYYKEPNRSFDTTLKKSDADTVRPNGMVVNELIGQCPISLLKKAMEVLEKQLELY